MDHCGLDLGKKSSRFCVVDEERRIVRQDAVKMREDRLTAVFGSMPPMRIALEACGNGFWVADLLEEMGHTPIVVDPGRVKAIGAARIKHDRLDARVLAELCCADLLPVVDRQSLSQRLRRMPVVGRDVLLRMRTMAINTVRGLLASEGVLLAPGREGRFLELADDALEEAPAEMVTAVVPVLDHIEQLNESIAQYDDALSELAREDETMKLLMTAPGVGPLTAAVFVFVVRRWERFPSGRAVAAYLGLVPSLYSSGQTHRLGRITKAGNRHLRWLLTMAANALLRTKKDSALKTWGLELAERSGRKKAKVAVARKLAAVLWAMWRDNRPFEARLAA